MKTMRVARMIMRMINAIRVTGVNMIITTTMKTMRVPGKNDNENDQAMRVTGVNMIITIRL